MWIESINVQFKFKFKLWLTFVCNIHYKCGLMYYQEKWMRRCSLGLLSHGCRAQGRTRKFSCFPSSLFSYLLYYHKLQSPRERICLSPSQSWCWLKVNVGMAWIGTFQYWESRICFCYAGWLASKCCYPFLLPLEVLRKSLRDWYVAFHFPNHLARFHFFSCLQVATWGVI